MYARNGLTRAFIVCKYKYARKTNEGVVAFCALGAITKYVIRSHLNSTYSTRNILCGCTPFWVCLSWLRDVKFDKHKSRFVSDLHFVD